MKTGRFFLIIVLSSPHLLAATGPYTEPGIAGYVNQTTRLPAAPTAPNGRVNPLLRCWPENLQEVVSYQPSDFDFFWHITDPNAPTTYDPDDPNQVLGPPSGYIYGTVSLGDQNETEYQNGDPPGQITLYFGGAKTIRNGSGYDLAVYENGFLSSNFSPWWIVKGTMFTELAYVEVSTDGITFSRFPGISLTTGIQGAYSTLEISNVFNLAGKHPNAEGKCCGTPFDLEDLSGNENVISGAVNLNNIHYVRIVDIPGNGHYYDDASLWLDPLSWPWAYYLNDHIIYDPWDQPNPSMPDGTYGSGGFDLDAVCALEEQQYSADINLDGVVNLLDYAVIVNAWGSRFGEARWMARCDLAQPKNLTVDTADLAAFFEQWLSVETWRNKTP